MRFALLSLVVAPAVASFASEVRDDSFVLDLPEGLPDAFGVELVVEGERLVLNLVQSDQRSSLFQVLVVGEDGAARAVEAPRPRTYRGSVEGHPSTLVAASLLDNGLAAVIVPPQGTPTFVEPAASGRHRFVTVDADDPMNATLSLPVRDAGFVGVQPPPNYAGAPDCAQVAEIAFDADFERFQALGSVGAVVADIDAIMNVVNVVYTRDALIRHETTQVIVRTSEPDPYTSNDAAQLLNQFRAEWNGNQSGVPRDVAHLVSGKNFNGGLLGIGFQGVVCELDLAYAATQQTGNLATRAALVGHMLGHNWNAPNCDGSEGCSLMCGLCLELAPSSIEAIRSFAAGLDCLDAGPGLTDPVPPKATADAAAGGGGLLVDVLANDYDGNCDPLFIDSFDGVTQQGGTVQLSPQTGPDDRDQLKYIAPAGYLGPDSFTYVVGDGLGGQDEGTVSIDVNCATTVYCDPNSWPTATIGIEGCDCGSGSMVVVGAGLPELVSSYLLVGASSGIVTNPPDAVGDFCLAGSPVGRYRLDVEVTIDGLSTLDLLDAMTAGGGGELPNNLGNVCMPPGQTWNFQFWHRQPAMLPSGFSPAFSVQFQ